MQSNSRVPREDAGNGKHAGLARHQRLSKRQLIKIALYEQEHNPYGDVPVEYPSRDEAGSMVRSMLS